jgi:hypothetical protein
VPAEGDPLLRATDPGHHGFESERAHQSTVAVAAAAG